MIAMARIIVFPKTTNFFSFFILEKSYDKLDDFDHNQASSEQEKESLKKLIQVWTVMQLLLFQSLGWENSALLPLLTPYLVVNDYTQPLFVFSVTVLARGDNTKAFNILPGYVLFSCIDIRELKQQRRRPLWERLLKSEFALPQS